MEFSRAKLYLVFVGVFLLIAGLIALYTFIENYISDKKANKKKVIFKKGNRKDIGKQNMARSMIKI